MKGKTAKQDTAHELRWRMTDKEWDVLSYWAKKQDVSNTEFVRMAVDHYIGFLNRDYDLPMAEIQRVNQLTDLIMGLSQNIKSLEHVTTSGFDSLLGLTRGDNQYLSEESDNDAV